MSRIGKLPVAIPAGVEVKLEDGNVITVKGPKGTLTRKLVDDLTVEVTDTEVTVTRPLIANMVEGVTNGYKKELEINGVGYRAAKSGNKLTLTLGYSHPVEMFDPEGITTTLEGNNKIIVEGIDKEKVGQFAAEIRTKRPPEPYKGKGIKYATETIRRKVGKTGKK